MEILTEKTNESLKFTLKGRLDTTTSPSLESAIADAIEGVTSLEFDLSDLEYISSAGLRVLLNSQKRMNKQGQMTISHANPDVKEIFEITGFSDILTLVD